MSKILVVEDEGVVAMDLEERLRAMHYDVAGPVGTSRAALQTVDAERPDLVLMDIMLGHGPDGLETARQIRARHQIPIVFVTAFSDDRILEQAKLTNPFGYILKPFEDREFRITIEMALYKHKVEREREDLIRQLQDALEQVKQLKGLLPICSYCKKIRDDSGYWSQVEEFICRHSDARFSHGFCPDCLVEHHPELAERINGEPAPRIEPALPSRGSPSDRLSDQ